MRKAKGQIVTLAVVAAATVATPVFIAGAAIGGAIAGGASMIGQDIYQGTKKGFKAFMNKIHPTKKVDKK
jgi:NADP-dependent 3-hydroxy acid dehydrogenase YdfG